MSRKKASRSCFYLSSHNGKVFFITHKESKSGKEKSSHYQLIYSDDTGSIS